MTTLTCELDVLCLLELLELIELLTEFTELCEPFSGTETPTACPELLTADETTLSTTMTEICSFLSAQAPSKHTEVKSDKIANDFLFMIDFPNFLCLYVCKVCLL